MVRDPQAAVLSGVKISARNLETGIVRTAMTDGEGRYVLAEMRVGAYELKAEADGISSRDETYTSEPRRNCGRIVYRCAANQRLGRHSCDRATCEYADAGAQLSRQRARDTRAAAQWTQLHRSRSASAWRRRLSASGWRVGGCSRTWYERQWSGLSLERIPARRDDSKRLHQWSGRKCSLDRRLASSRFVNFASR